MKVVGSSPGSAAFDFNPFVGKLTDNCRKTPSRENRNRRKFPLISSHRINLICMLKKGSVPLILESVTSGQADGGFRQLFLQSIFVYIHSWLTDKITTGYFSSRINIYQCWESEHREKSRVRSHACTPLKLPPNDQRLSYKKEECLLCLVYLEFFF